MRALVFFLILANLLFWAWVQGYLGMSTNPDALRAQQQLLADRVKIVSHDESPRDAAKAQEKEDAVEKTVEKPQESAEEKSEISQVGEQENKVVENPVRACLRLNDVPADDVGRLEKSLAEQLPDFNVARTATREASTSYWVYIPPLATKKDVDIKVAELKKLQVEEYFVIQESGPNNHAISLGLFSTREAADSLMADLKAKKVRSARVAERHTKPAMATIEIQGPGSGGEALRQIISELIPGSSAAACGASASSAKQ